MKILKHEKFLELWLSQKRLAPCACACGKSPKHFIEDMNFETRQRCGTCPPSKQQNEVHVPTMGSTCLHWSLSSFLQRLHPWWFPPRQECWPRGP